MVDNAFGANVRQCNYVFCAFSRITNTSFAIKMIMNASSITSRPILPIGQTMGKNLKPEIKTPPFKKPESRLPKSLRLRKSVGGDGGNRTRVRKTRPSEIYERSRLGMSPQVTQPAKLTCSQPLGPESPLSRSQRHRARHSTFVTPNPLTGWRTVRADAASSRRPADQQLAYAARGIAA